MYCYNINVTQTKENKVEFTTTSIFRLVTEKPGITAPSVCLVIGEHVWPQPSFAGVSNGRLPITDDEIVSNLLEENPESWFKTCDLIDILLDEGAIFMNDDGKMFNPMTCN
jgi:hypothetical protein|tara:strand:+ start:466 stop:798 length:333 start_codon:yes stop_codon:yes gene_type:complete